eukprot:98566-Chlamydomonas_euryale.AAC.11
MPGRTSLNLPTTACFTMSITTSAPRMRRLSRRIMVLGTHVALLSISCMRARSGSWCWGPMWRCCPYPACARRGTCGARSRRAADASMSAQACGPCTPVLHVV